MKDYNVCVRFRDKIVQFSDLLEKGIFSESSAYKYLKRGLNFQEIATHFEEIWFQDITLYNEKITIQELVANEWLDYNYYASRLLLGKSPQSIVKYYLSTHPEIEKNIAKNIAFFQFIKEKYTSVSEFIEKENVDIETICVLHEKYPKMALEAILSFYRKTIPSEQDSLYFGIRLKAICSSLNLNYNFCSSQKGIPIEEVLDMSIFAIPKMTSIRINRLMSYRQVIKKMIQENNVDIHKIPGILPKDIPFIENYIQKTVQVQSAIQIYKLVYFMEENWQNIYIEEIRGLDNLYGIGSPKYNEGCKLIKNVVQKRELEKNELTFEQYLQLRKVYYKDFEFMQYNGNNFYRQKKAKKDKGSKIINIRKADVREKKLLKAEEIKTEEIKTEKPLKAKEIKTEKPLKAKEIKTEMPLKAEEIKTEKPLKAKEIKTETPLKAEEIKTKMPLKAEEIKTEMPLKAEEIKTEMPLKAEEIKTEMPLKAEEIKTEIPLKAEEIKTKKTLKPSKTLFLEQYINGFLSLTMLNSLNGRDKYNFMNIDFVMNYFGESTSKAFLEKINSKCHIKFKKNVNADLKRFWFKDDHFNKYTTYELNVFNIVNYFIYFQGNISLVESKTNRHVDDIITCLKYPKMNTIFQPFVNDKLKEYLEFSCLFTKSDALKSNKISLSVLATFLKNNGNLMATMTETGYPITIIRFILNSSYIHIQSDEKTRNFIKENLLSQKDISDNLMESVSRDLVYECKTLEQACLSAKISVPYFYSNILPEIKLFNQARYVMILDLLNRQKIINEENRCRELIDTKEE